MKHAERGDGGEGKQNMGYWILDLLGRLGSHGGPINASNTSVGRTALKASAR